MTPSIRHSLINIAQSVLLIGGMGAIAWACVTAIWGGEAALWVFAGIGLMLALSPALPSDMMLSLYGARRIEPQQFPEGLAILNDLARRAEIPDVPTLYYLPSAMPMAFTTGRGESLAIALSDGMLRLLNARELRGVLAHEISHVAHGDLWIMRLADVMSRATTITSYAGQLLLVLNLPLLLAGEAHVPWTAVLLLVFSPTLTSLLQLALSRTREFSADQGAAQLTGDPAALASALLKLERTAGRFWEEMVMPGRRIPAPSVLRTHPRTDDRIARLKALAPDAFRPRPRAEEERLVPRWPMIENPPRWRRTGVWY